jgi:DNA polymerase
LRQAALRCRGCDLYERATQTVFGEGPRGAAILLVGEQPGDREDVDGKPFVGPAGTLLRRALEEAGIAAHDVYLTNAVKHFRYVVRGKRRIHQKPRTIEIQACRPWLEAELSSVRAKVVVALGATAATSLLGRTVRIAEHRGRPQPFGGDRAIVVTVHPSNILRQRDAGARRAAFAEFVSDLSTVAMLL